MNLRANSLRQKTNSKTNNNKCQKEITKFDKFHKNTLTTHNRSMKKVLLWLVGVLFFATSSISGFNNLSFAQSVPNLKSEGEQTLLLLGSESKEEGQNNQTKNTGMEETAIKNLSAEENEYANGNSEIENKPTQSRNLPTSEKELVEILKLVNASLSESELNILKKSLEENFDGIIEFDYKGRQFIYDLEKNKKTSVLFYENYEINKYNRFGTTDDRKTLLIKMLNAGIDIKVALNYLFPNLKDTIEQIANNIKTEPKDARLSINSNSEKVFTIAPEQVGVSLNENQLYNDICHSFLQSKALKFDIPTIKTKPQILSSELKNFTHLRADFSTDISSSSADRKHNIKTALRSLNKLTLLPGQTFSFNQTVGRRTEQNGYRTAKIIVNNEFVDGVGGGVCQVSTTLYNTALLAGLKIDEANKHSRQIGYVKYGFDAMVNYGSSDLRFTNNTDEKIIIITNYSSSRARIRIFGKDMGGVSYKLKNKILSTTELKDEIIVDTAGEYADKVEYEDESFYIKRPTRGMEIESMREKYVAGKLVSSEILRRDKYTAQKGIKVVGAKKREPILTLPFLDFAV